MDWVSLEHGQYMNTLLTCIKVDTATCEKQYVITIMINL